VLAANGSKHKKPALGDARVMKIKKMIVGAFLMVMAISAAAFAQGNNNPAVYNGPVKAVNVMILPDLEVKIEAFEDAACTKAIANNGYMFESAAWVRLTIKNKGAVAAENFTYKGVIDVDGNKVYNPDAAKMTLAANQSKQLAVVKVPLGGTTDVVTAKLLADIGNFVKETNEANNSATFKFTSQTAH
jgi:subtilase family serine protease